MIAAVKTLTANKDRRLGLPIPLLPTVFGINRDRWSCAQRVSSHHETRKEHLKTSAVGSTTILVVPAGILPAALPLFPFPLSACIRAIRSPLRSFRPTKTHAAVRSHTIKYALFSECSDEPSTFRGKCCDKPPHPTAFYHFLPPVCPSYSKIFRVITSLSKLLSDKNISH